MTRRQWDRIWKKFDDWWDFLYLKEMNKDVDIMYKKIEQLVEEELRRENGKKT